MPPGYCPRIVVVASELLEQQFAALPPRSGVRCRPSDGAGILESVARRLGDNYPYFHPLYAGQMLKRRTRWRVPPTRWP